VISVLSVEIFSTFRADFEKAHLICALGLL
jgi:hypothetical protein